MRTPVLVCLIAGLAEETFFFRELLDKLQVKPYPDLRAEFKNLYNYLTHKGYSKPHQEATQSLVEQLHEATC